MQYAPKQTQQNPLHKSKRKQLSQRHPLLSGFARIHQTLAHEPALLQAIFPVLFCCYLKVRIYILRFRFLHPNILRYTFFRMLHMGRCRPESCIPDISMWHYRLCLWSFQVGIFQVVLMRFRSDKSSCCWLFLVPIHNRFRYHTSHKSHIRRFCRICCKEHMLRSFLNSDSLPFLLLYRYVVIQRHVFFW